MTGDGGPQGMHGGVVVVIFCVFGFVVFLLIAYSILKAICDGRPPDHPRVTTTTTRPVGSTAAPAAIVAVTDDDDDNLSRAIALQSVLLTLPDFVYSSPAQKKKINCSVCLMDLRDGEKGRFLPRCFHCFHVDCIDVWLATHSECPVCRASIDPVAPELAV